MKHDRPRFAGRCTRWAGALLFVACHAAAAAASAWPDWDTFAGRFVAPEGRVVDVTFGGKTVSEGQGYGMFFALVANDRPHFDALLAWTSRNLAGGRLGEELPAWLWSANAAGGFGVKDTNSASDADLWIAYDLLEASRLWKAPAYAVTARRLLATIDGREVADASNAGPLLLPGASGFDLDGGRYRIDPSYLPGFLLAGLADDDPAGPWQSIWNGWLKLAPAVLPHGIAPNLFVVNRSGTVSPDTVSPPLGSYDAIRVYLWAGMSGHNSTSLLTLLRPFDELVRATGAPPEQIDPLSGKVLRVDFSPIGFSGAILPFLDALGDKASLAVQLDRLHTASLRARLGAATNYYDQALILFGTGWLDKQYRFDDAGHLQPRWLSSR